MSTDPHTVMDAEWFANRARLWTQDAVALLTMLEEYEEYHPSVKDGVPCLAEALEACRKAVHG